MSLVTDGKAPWAIDWYGQACCYKHGHWQWFESRDLHQLSVCGCHRWGVTRDSRLIHRIGDDKNDDWKVLDTNVKLKQVSAVSDDRTLFCIDQEGIVRVFSTHGEQLRTLSCDAGEFRQISVSEDGLHIWGISTSGRVFYRAGLDGSWEQVSGLLCQIAVSADGWHVWGINCDAEIYYRAGKDGNWAELRRKAWQLKEVCVSTDGWQLWGIDKLGSVWTFAA